MIAAATVMVAGITLVAFLSQTYGYRVGGVMVLPLLAVYTFREPLSPVIFGIGTAAAWVSLWGIREYTLNHGRRLFLIAVTVGAIASLVAGFAFSRFLPARLPFEDAEVIASIFPGVAAYNLMRLDPEDRFSDLLAMISGYVGLVAVGLGSLWVLDSVGSPTPPVLALPTSDLIFWFGIDPHGSVLQTITPNWLSISLLIVDVVIYEFFRKRYDHRLAGIIVLPMLAVFSVRYGSTVFVYAIGATAVFFFISAIHWVTLLYGRVLLALSLISGTLFALTVSVWQPTPAPGITLFFLGLFIGIGAYNLHRVTPKNRPAHIRISAALFVVFYATILAFVDIPDEGLMHSPQIAHLLLGVLVVALAAVEVYRLDQSRPDGRAFARESVFADLSLDGADIEDSPLVANEEDR